MRPRKKKNLPERMEACADLWIRQPEQQRGRWRELFSESDRLSVELGCGKGTFICTLAAREPQNCFVAVEKVPDVLVMAMEKAEQMQLKNLRFVSADAKDIEDIFAPDEIDALYINFCDPWHKKRHYKRRLTYRGFLERFSRVLRQDALLQFKTDNAPLFEFSLPEFEAAGYETVSMTRDLHALGDESNIVTEYEANFSAKGFAINRLIARNARRPVDCEK